MSTASIIIINFNTANLTLQAIHSIEQHITAIENFEVIIIDNASDNEDYNDLKLGIAKLNTINIKLVKSKFNLGFGGGNMLGVQHAVGDYYVFMNSDVILKEDSVSMMIGFINTHKNTSIVGCQAVNENGQKYKGFDYGLSLANELFSNSILQFINKKKYPSRIVTTKEPLVVDSVAGSLFTCLAKDFDAVGGFDTNIFLYYEEKDLAFRIKKHLNKEVYLLPFTEYIHLKGKSSITSQKMRLSEKVFVFLTKK
jgi:GT2 family glycosyltransferase